GQFWTPQWVAKAMVAYFLQGESSELFDPAVGAGAFYQALKCLDTDRKIAFYGTDISMEAVKQGTREQVFDSASAIEIRDFILNPPQRKFSAIIANPPYIRHHRLSTEMKAELKKLTLRNIGKKIDGRAGIHIYFLIQALGLLENHGKLSFIMPADTCEGVFADTLWHWITSRYCLETVVIFDSEATPFPSVDTNAVIFFISNNPPKKSINWIRVRKETSELFDYFGSGSHEPEASYLDLDITERDISEALITGLSRKPAIVSRSGYKLGDFAKIIRGIATGSNEFFFLTRKQARQLEIPQEYLKTAVGRTRDVTTSTITTEDTDRIDQKGRPTLLLCLGDQSTTILPVALQNYIKQGVEKKLHEKILISTRNPWYKMERREPPPFLFAYLGRRSVRFIKNEAGVIPLTGFLCLYPHSQDSAYIANLWQVLQHEETVNNLALVGKSYGSGAIKVEPRALANLPLPKHLVDRYLSPTPTPSLSHSQPNQEKPSLPPQLILFA
ncbi:MAG TPA: N-6 DNA methylase, partial [Candidatus Contendobacter sp.]|nr:N-6 DNA methylase [Candidatus Contendobacter sp.]